LKISGICACLLFTLFGFGPASFAADWKELRGEHFMVFYAQEEAQARQVLDSAEVFYRRIASQLGYPRYSEFWTWDKRVKIYIYPDHDSFLKATGQPKWSQGIADYNAKQIISFAWSSGFVESLLPHEIAHLIFRDFVGFKGEVPLWLDEGVAQWTEEWKRQQVNGIAGGLLKKGALIPLKKLMTLDIRGIKEGKDSGALINTYYIQSVSLVTFLIQRFGLNSFTDFCRQLREGKTLEEALRSAYPAHIQSIDELEKKWKEYLAAQ